MSVHSSYPWAAHRVYVSKSAVFRRLKRKLARQGATLRKCRRNTFWWFDRGDFYTTDAKKHTIDTHIDVVATAKKMFVLDCWEKVVR